MGNTPLPQVRILAISDLHGDLAAAWEAVEAFRPDALVSCGDWGDPAEVDESTLTKLIDRLPVFSTFGNHDPVELLSRLRNRDGSGVLLEQGQVRAVEGVRLAAIGGIWAKSHRQPYYVTDEDVAAAAARIADSGGTDVLMTHGCPIGLSDRTPRNTHGGQRCFLEAFQSVQPRLHLCGHLHVAQEHALKDGRKVINVGATPRGTVVVVEARGVEMTASLEQFQRATQGSASAATNR